MNSDMVAGIEAFIESFMEALAPFMIILVIWAVIAVGFFVWYLWAMSRLFPRIGLSAGQGWIPLWNEWKLMSRAGLPGWTALLYLVGLGIVPVIFRTIAQHRIGRETGVGGGYTFLGLILPPLWATLLAGLLHGQVLGDPRTATWPAANHPQTPTAAPSYAAATGSVQPAQHGGVHPYAAPAFQPTQAGHQSPQPAPQTTPWGAPVATPATPTMPSAPPTLTFAQLSAEAGTPFTQETEAEYARLANEAFLAAPAAPLGQAVASEPFSWTAASQSVEPDPLPPIQAPPVHPVAVRPILPVAPAAPPAVPILPASPSAPETLASPAAPIVPAAPAFPASNSRAFVTESHAPAIPLPPGYDTRTNAVEQGAATPVSALPSSSGITANYNPLPPVESASDPYNDEFDRTVVVQRTPELVWFMVLPDGSQLPLSSDTIVGRRPAAHDGAVALEIPDPTRTLSKTHARLRFDNEQWTVEDLGSTNGVFLLSEDGTEREVAPGQVMQTGPRLMLGTLEVRLRRSDEVETRG